MQKLVHVIASPSNLLCPSIAFIFFLSSLCPEMLILLEQSQTFLDRSVPITTSVASTLNCQPQTKYTVTISQDLQYRTIFQALHPSWLAILYGCNNKIIIG